MTEVVFSNEMDEEMTLNMGPHHPSTHGVLRFIIKSDGEIIRRAIPDVGYLHRSIEKIGLMVVLSVEPPQALRRDSSADDVDALPSPVDERQRATRHLCRQLAHDHGDVSRAERDGPGR